MDDRHDVGVALVYRAIKAYRVPMDFEGSIARTLTANTDHFPNASQSYALWLLTCPADLRR